MINHLENVHLPPDAGFVLGSYRDVGSLACHLDTLIELALGQVDESECSVAKGIILDSPRPDWYGQIWIGGSGGEI